VTGKLTIELGDFSFVQGYGSTGRLLRCSLTWKFEEEGTGKVIGTTTEGCLVSRASNGKIYFSTPMSMLTNKTKRRLQVITPDLHALIVDTVMKSRYADHIGGGVPKAFQGVGPQDVDPTLPSELTAEVQV
jgi:hypothetical protein